MATELSHSMPLNLFGPKTTTLDILLPFCKKAWTENIYIVDLFIWVLVKPIIDAKSQNFAIQSKWYTWKPATQSKPSHFTFWLNTIEYSLHILYSLPHVLSQLLQTSSLFSSSLLFFWKLLILLLFLILWIWAHYTYWTLLFLYMVVCFSISRQCQPKSILLVPKSHL